MNVITIIIILLLNFCFKIVQCWNEVEVFPKLPVTVTKTSNVICKENGQVYLENLRNFTLWAHQMWDSTSKSTAGILSGNRFQMGHFEQCLLTKGPFPTQYCLATITANVQKPKVTRDEFSLNYDPGHSIFERLYFYNDKSQQSRQDAQIAWCLPASCTILNMEDFLNNEYFNKINNVFTKQNVSYKAKLTPDLCTTNSDFDYFDNVDISFCLLSLILILTVIWGTAYDYMRQGKITKNDTFSNFLMAFSARKNFEDLNKFDESNPNLKILYGIKTVCIMAIITDHRIGTFTSSAVYNFNYVERQYRSIGTCLFYHGDLFVDTFFFLSGLLVIYGLLTQFDKKIINPLILIILRYVRLTPAYAYVIFYYASMFNHTGRGPLWKLIAAGDWRDCRTNWWTNLIYINNYVNADHMCMTHAWYLPCDFHYFILAIFLCHLIRKNRKLGIGTLAILTLISMIIPFVITIIYNRPGLLYFYPEFLTGPKTHVDFLLTYSKSHTRATPYFMGMFAGFVYYRFNGVKRHVCWMKSSIITLSSILIMATVIFGAKIFYDPHHPYNAIESAAYAALHRFAWALGSFGIFYVTSFGHGDFFKKILEWQPWIPLSKLVYGAYLTHMSFQLRWAANFHKPQQIGYFNLISLSFSDIVWAFVAALCLYLMIEAPFRKIFKEIFFATKNVNKKINVDVITTNNTSNVSVNAACNNEESRL